MIIEFTCAECKHSFDETNGDLDERLCNKCLDKIYDGYSKVEQIMSYDLGKVHNELKNDHYIDKNSKPENEMMETTEAEERALVLRQLFVLRQDVEYIKQILMRINEKWN